MTSDVLFQIGNPSLLIQEYGFLNLPPYVKITPAAGFGKLLPGEQLNVNVIFSAVKAANYIFDIILRSLDGFEEKISCKAVGVHPPIKVGCPWGQYHKTSYMKIYLV